MQLESKPGRDVVSTFETRDEALAAVSTTLQQNRSAIDAWVLKGASKTLALTAPFDGGKILVRGTNETIAGSEALVILKGDGKGKWFILTGYMNLGTHEPLRDAGVSESVRQFFGGSFHQDWDDEAKDWQTAVDVFMVGETTTRLHSLALEIDHLCVTYREDELRMVLLRHALSSYYPGPLTHHEWLRQVSKRLRQHADVIEGNTASTQTQPE